MKRVDSKIRARLRTKWHSRIWIVPVSVITRESLRILIERARDSNGVTEWSQQGA